MVLAVAPVAASAATIKVPEGTELIVRFDDKLSSGTNTEGDQFSISLDDDVKLSDGSYLLAGKNVSSFTNAEEANYAKADVPFELETALVKQGAIFHQVEPWQAFSIADGHLVTGQNPASAKGVGEKMVALLKAG